MALSKSSMWALSLAGVAAGAVAVGWLFKRSASAELPPPPVSDARQSAPPRAALRPPLSELEALAAHLLEWPAPESVVVPSAPASERVTARPRATTDYPILVDDYDSMDPEDMGAAFLAGATDTALEPPPRSTAELSGFQIFEGPDAERS